MSPSRQSTTIAPRPSTTKVSPTSTPTAAVLPATQEDTKSLNPRILRKREADRKCQRLIRERTKSRIAELEATVKEYERRDVSGLSTLLKNLAAARHERDTLARKVKNIEGVLKDGRAVTNEANGQDVEPDAGSVLHAAESLLSDTAIGRGSHLRKASVEEATLAETSPRSTDSTSPAIPSFSNTQLEGNSIDRDNDILFDNGAIETVTQSNPIYPEPEQPCHCSTPSQPLQRNGYYNAWRYANEVLSSRFQWPVDYNTMLVDGFKDDIPIRAVVDGWDAVERRGAVHPSWQILKKIDQALFWRCGPRERLAVLYIMHLLFCSHSNTITSAASELPQYYLKGPSSSGPHSYAINYFIWPGIRQRFFQNQHRYCTNDFWSIFSRNLNVQWPYEFRDCYTRNTETGLYGISSSFLGRINELSTWTMGPELFERWPEFRTDIPACNTVPAAISARPTRHDVIRRNSRTASMSCGHQHSGRHPPSDNSDRRSHSNASNMTPLAMNHVESSVFDPSQWGELIHLQTSDLAYESLIPGSMGGFPSHFT